MFIYIFRKEFLSKLDNKINIQDDHYLYIYLTSLYFVIVRVTTVGYGDITGDTIPKIVFQMVLLILGNNKRLLI